MIIHTKKIGYNIKLNDLVLEDIFVIKHQEWRFSSTKGAALICQLFFNNFLMKNLL